MSLTHKLRAAAADPVRAGYHAWSRFNAEGLFAKYRRRARAVGLDKAYLVVSFDCDTEEDAKVAAEVNARLLEMGIRSAYAVPGDLLREAAHVYRGIAATGAEFLNHGSRRHTYFDTSAGEHRSCFFYDEQPLETVAEDIRGGDAAVRDVIGVPPLGFRTPHFGTFQKPAHLRFLHQLLGELGYRFSTSTTPLFGFRLGPASNGFGLWELPVSGGVSHPLGVLDSWGCFKAPNRQLGPSDYRREAIGMAHRLGSPAILNFYADPSHIADQPEFFATMAELKALATPATYGEILGLLR